MRQCARHDGCYRELPWIKLILERHDGAAVAADRGYFLQFPVGAGNGHNGTVAVDGVAVGGEVPAPPSGPLAQLRGRLVQWLLWG